MKKEKFVVISIGGHLLTKGATSIEGMSADRFKVYADVLKKIKSKGYRVIAVIGGGKFLRDFMAFGRKLGASKSIQDGIGIYWTHVNALLMAATVGNEAEQESFWPEKETDEIILAAKSGKIVLCGGDTPGHSTDWDAVYIAKRIKEMGRDVIFINATLADAIYNKDPSKYPDAKKLKKISFKDYVKLASTTYQEPGGYQLDLEAAKLMDKGKIKSIFINGLDPDEILKAVEGKHSGTVIE